MGRLFPAETANRHEIIIERKGRNCTGTNVLFEWFSIGWVHPIKFIFQSVKIQPVVSWRSM